MLMHLIIYAAAFIGIWVGAGMAITSVEKMAQKLRLSSFLVSFLVLGFFTSISEVSVGVNAVLSGDPGIFVGNLIGASIVLFLMVIPLLAITGKPITINKEVRGHNLILPLIVVAIPVLLSFDGIVSRIDAIIAVVLFALSALVLEQRKGFVKNVAKFAQFKNLSIAHEFTKIVVGALIIYGSSWVVVNQTEYFSKALGLTEFFISLMVIGIGTNLPELSLIVRSLFMKSNQVAFGDYLGSASFNSFLYGILTLWHGKPIILNNSYAVSLGFLIVGLILFYIFAKSKHTISRIEALGLFSLYVAFFLIEVFTHLPTF
jgi:cation:H+ antiporter